MDDPAGGIPAGIDDIDRLWTDNLNDGSDIAVIIQVDIDRQFRTRVQEVLGFEKDAPHAYVFDLRFDKIRIDVIFARQSHLQSFVSAAVDACIKAVGDFFFHQVVAHENVVFIPVELEFFKTAAVVSFDVLPDFGALADEDDDLATADLTDQLDDAIVERVGHGDRQQPVMLFDG